MPLIETTLQHGADPNLPFSTSDDSRERNRLILQEVIKGMEIVFNRLNFTVLVVGTPLNSQTSLVNFEGWQYTTLDGTLARLKDFLDQHCVKWRQFGNLRLESKFLGMKTRKPRNKIPRTKLLNMRQLTTCARLRPSMNLVLFFSIAAQELRSTAGSLHHKRSICFLREPFGSCRSTPNQPIHMVSHMSPKAPRRV